MPSKGEKRKLSEIGDGKLRLGVIDELVKKTKSYVHPPTSLTVTPAPVTDSPGWISFSAKAEYIPIGLINESTNKVITDPSITVEIKIVGKDMPVKAKPYSAVASHMKGVYWFKTFKGHVPGNITLTFTSSEPSIEPLSYDITVVGKQAKVMTPKDEKTAKKKEKESVKKRQKKEEKGEGKGADPLVEESDPQSQLAESEENISTSSVSSVEAVKKPPSKSKPKPKEEEIKPKVLKPATLPPNFDAKSFFNSFKDPPTYETLDQKTRFERPVGLKPSTEGTAGKDDSLLLQGTYLEVRLPCSLVRALLDDREVNASQLVEYKKQLVELKANQGSSSSSAGGSKRSKSKSGKDSVGGVVELPVILKKPSTHELLQKLESRCNEKFTKKWSIEDTTREVERLRLMFEFFFVDQVLYSAEKEVMLSELQALQDKKICFSEEFGAFFLLRFIVLLVVGMKPTLLEENKDIDKKSFEGLTKVVKELILMLDEQAHVLFY